MNTIDAITHMSMSILMSIAIGLENGSLGGKSAHTGCQNGCSEMKVHEFGFTKMINCKENAWQIGLVKNYLIYVIMAFFKSQNGP